MSKKFKEIPISIPNGIIEAIDIDTMAEMTDDEYIDYVKNDNLLYVDHHGALRCFKTGRPFACSQRQLDLLVDYLRYERQNVGEE